MAPQVQTPVKGFNGIVVGVSFVDGVGDTDDPAALAYFERQGYTIEASAEAAGKELSPKQKLVAEATELKLDTKGTADELAARIAEHKAKAGADEAAEAERLAAEAERLAAEAKAVADAAGKEQG